MVQNAWGNCAHAQEGGGPGETLILLSVPLSWDTRQTDLGIRIGILVAARVADPRATTAPRPTPHMNNSRNYTSVVAR